MKIADYNKLPSRINFYDEALCLYPYTLLSEKLLLVSSISFDILLYNNFDKLKDILIIGECIYHFGEDEGLKAFFEDVKVKQKQVDKIKRQKFKDKNTLHLIGVQKGFVAKLRGTLKEHYERRLSTFKITELIGYEKEDCWIIKFPLLNIKKNQEDVYIPALTETIIENEYVMEFDGIVERLFTHVDIDATGSTSFDFIKIPLWDLPLIEGIKFNQMKYSQQDLKASLQEFTKHFDELSEQLFKMPFTLENQAEIIGLAKEKIMAQALPVQQAIDTSLYLTQFRNQSPPNTGMKFHLGITSAENLVNYYEKTEMIEAYVASEIKEQLRRYINLQATCFFTYITIQKPSYNVQ